MSALAGDGLVSVAAPDGIGDAEAGAGADHESRTTAHRRPWLQCHEIALLQTVDSGGGRVEVVDERRRGAGEPGCDRVCIGGPVAMVETGVVIENGRRPSTA